VASSTQAKSDFDRALSGDIRALARLLSLAEDESPRMREVIRELLPRTGDARIIGLTGAPGVGKSTMTGALVGAFRAAGLRVAVLAVDPTSPFTGGALLGDRIRMQEHATDEAVFIRSMASRGHLGGLAAATPQAIRVLDAVGFDLIIVETVGVGQAEVAIASLADTVVVLLAPGMGDAVQAAKAGILEVADLFVVNKADRPDAHQVVRDVRNMLALGTTEPGGWKPPIITAVASNGPRDDGVAELITRLDAHWDWLRSSGELQRRRRARAREEITALAFAALRDRVANSVDELAAQVADGTLDPFQAAEEVLAGQAEEALAGQAEGLPGPRAERADHAHKAYNADNGARAPQKELRLYPWVSLLSCRLIPSTARPGSGRPDSARRRRWPPSPQSCGPSRSCSPSSMRCCGPTS
jgi:LAO/AO transport system kinase